MGNDFRVFVAIHGENTIASLMGQLVGQRIPVYFRDHEEPQFALETIRTLDASHIECRWTTKPPQTFQAGIQCSWSFYIAGDKYIFESKPSYEKGLVILEAHSVFRIQKRQNFRFHIPLSAVEQMAKSVTVTDLKKPGITMTLLDITNEGIGVLVSSKETPYKVGETSRLRISYDKNPPFEMEVKVMQSKKNSTENLVTGMKITNTSPQLEIQILDFIQFLRHQAFAKTA